MKKISVVFLIIAVMLLSGCYDVSIGSDSLLNAPSMNEEQSDIYKVLIDSVGSNIKLAYPQSGDNRSAFVLGNIDDEPGKEAIVFYTKEGSSDKNITVRVNVIDYINDKWVSVYDMSGEGKNIDKVIVKKCNGKNTIFIGYSTINKSSNILYAYSYNQKRLESIYSFQYKYFDIFDLDGDHQNDLFTIESVNDENVASANLYGNIAADQVYIKSSVDLGAPFSNYVNIVTGKTASGEKSVVLDSYVNKSTIATEIISCANGKLYNPLYQFKYDLYEKTQRDNKYFSMDFNQDGIVDIPVTSTFCGYENSADEDKIYMTDWYDFNKYYSLDKAYSTYYNRNDAYVFVLPSRWVGLVTIKKDPITDEIVFYKYNVDLDSSSIELIRIKATERKNSLKYYNNDYKLIDTKGQIDYFIKINQEVEDNLKITNAEIMNSFYVL